MRLIDADALITKLIDCDLDHAQANDGTELIVLVLEEPTIEERKNGKWVQVDEQPYFRKHFHDVCCSECHRKGNKNWNYCPNCGARMES